MKLDDDIHNYYEHLVLERISKLGIDKTKAQITWLTYAAWL